MAAPRTVTDQIPWATLDLEAVAITSEAGDLTYEELRAAVDTIAKQLRGLGIKEGTRVGLHFPRSEEYIVALLAVWQASAIAVPLDTEVPRGRRTQMAELAGLQVVIDSVRHPESLNTDVPLHLRISASGRKLLTVARQKQPSNVRANGVAAPGTALLLFTSGSTGVPKGVWLNHAGLLNRLTWGQEYFRLTSFDVVLHKASVGFDASLHEILSPLLVGARSVVIPPGMSYDPTGLIEQIREQGVTVAHFVPSVLSLLVSHDEYRTCASIRLILSGGEPLSMQLVRQAQLLTGVQLVNQYGPTETSLSVLYWPSDRSTDSLIAPLGYPIEGVLLEVVPLGSEITGNTVCREGELYISGVPLGDGYVAGTASIAEQQAWTIDSSGKRWYKTGDLVRLDDHGCYYYLGRKDQQLKIHGVRVEPEEVRLVLERHPAVAEAAVGVTSRDGKPELIAVVRATVETQPRRLGYPRLALPNGLVVTAPSTDEAAFLYNLIWNEHEYDRHGVVVPHRGTIIDIGANVGLFTLWAFSRSPYSRFILCEPNPDVLACLRINIAEHGINADILDTAVGLRTDEQIEFTSYPELTYLSGRGARTEDADRLVRSRSTSQSAALNPLDQESRVAQSRLNARTHVVRSTTLSSIIAAHAVEEIDLLKINVEGAEVDVLQGIGDGDWPRIRQVVLELEGRQKNEGPVRALLEQRGFTVRAEQDWNLGKDADVAYIYAVRRGDEVSPAPLDRESDMKPAELLSVRQLRRFIRESLPAAMHPTTFLIVEDIPRTTSGKVAFNDVLAQRGAIEPAESNRTSDRDWLRELWRSELRIDEVNDDDDFRSLGGHSLMGARITAQAQARFQKRVLASSCETCPSFGVWASTVLDSDA